MNIALVLSGGCGRRMGWGIPKQYIEVAGKMVISYCLEVFENHREIDAIQIAADAGWHERIRNCTGAKFKGFSLPGANRQISILNGLKDILCYADGSDIVVIHDAARPLVTEKLISECIAACGGHDGAMPILPVKDTMYLYQEGRVAALLDREHICAGQAPEVYRLGKYYDANKALLPDRILEIHGSTEAAFLGGLDVAIVMGDEGNFKITTAQDMERFKRMVTQK